MMVGGGEASMREGFDLRVGAERDDEGVWGCLESMARSCCANRFVWLRNICAR